MEQFNLEKYLENPSRKVVTRDGREVEIFYYNADKTLLVGRISPTEIHQYTKDGFQYEDMCQAKNDLFFVDEEKLNRIIDELKSYLEKTPKEQVEKDWKEIQDWYTQHFTNKKHNEEDELTEFEKRFIELIRLWRSGNTNPEENLTQSQFDAKELLDLARKEILKSLPKWKKMPSGIQGNNKLEPTYLIRTDYGFYFTSSCLSGSENNMYIELVELENLPKE